MKNDYNDHEKRWCKTWKSLVLLRNVFLIMIIPLQLLAKDALKTSREIPTYQSIMANILCHMGMLYVVIYFIMNYDVLVQQRKIERSRKTFWKAFLPFIIVEVMNLSILIFL